MTGHAPGSSARTRAADETTRRPAHEQDVPVFAWITGERTNVGDSLLRRPYVAALRRIGRLELWIRTSTPDFLTGLGLEDDVVLTPGFAVWYARLLRSALRRRTVVVLNAGESRVEGSRALLLSALLVAGLVVRVRGGSSVWVGVGVPASGRRLLRIPYRLAGRIIDYVQWREAGSATTAAPRAVGADWAFVEGAPASAWSPDRDLLGIVLRGDRPAPSAAWLSWIRTLCADHGLSPVVVVQVRQDDGRARELADALDATVVEWPTEATHAEQETRVREVYGRCRAVVGDRLHGLVIAATEGAVPLGWVESSRGKIRAHFDVARLPDAGRHEGRPAADLPRVTAAELTRQANLLAEAVSRVRSELRTLQDDLAALGGSGAPHELARLRRRQRPRTRSRALRNAAE